MVYMVSASYFCMSTDTITDMDNSYMGGCHTAPPHPLEGLADASSLADRAPEQANYEQWMQTPPKHQAHALAQVGFYLNNFI